MASCSARRAGLSSLSEKARRSLCATALVLGTIAGCAEPRALVMGEVRDQQGPVADARVRVQGQKDSTLSDKKGRFCLPQGDANLPISAWKEGYAIAHASARQNPLKLELLRLPEKDNPDYAWIDPSPSRTDKKNCANCHGLIHEEWSASGHARAAENRRFLNLFAGTDWHGKPSRTWSLKDEHPLGTGVCASCHAPTHSDPTLEYDMTRVQGVAKKGVHCDYCHKIVEAPTDKLGTRFGRDGLRLLRPAKGEQLFFGPLDDAVRPGETFGYSPLYKKSRYCASCHEGVIFGVHVYSTYSEWLDSPAKKQGQQCQDCHMKPTGKMTNIAPNKGGIERDPHTLASHALPGGQKQMLEQCLEVKVSAGAKRGQLTVEVLAKNVGHRVPTGFIDRQLLLVVEGRDAKGNILPALTGPKLPKSAGPSFGGAAGKLYAKALLAEDGRPVPFWLAEKRPQDSRLRPEQGDQITFNFGLNLATTRVRLIYRRFWHEVAASKGWPDNDLVVIDQEGKP